MKRLAFVLVLAVVAGGFAWWWFLPENVIKRQLGSLLEAAEVTATMSDAEIGVAGRPESQRS